MSLFAFRICQWYVAGFKNFKIIEDELQIAINDATTEARYDKTNQDKLKKKS